MENTEPTFGCIVESELLPEHSPEKRGYFIRACIWKKSPSWEVTNGKGAKWYFYQNAVRVVQKSTVSPLY